MRRYVDADIMIEHLRGRPLAVDLMRHLVSQDEDLWMSAAQRIEVAFHTRPGEEARTAALFALFSTQPVTEEVVDLGALLYRRWHPSHGTGENDAVLAATVAITGGSILTQNVRHFPMPEIIAERGWDST